MNTLESLEQQIEKTKKLLIETRENYDNNPESYSAKLLHLSTENYLGDLLREMELRKNEQHSDD